MAKQLPAGMTETDDNDLSARGIIMDKEDGGFVSVTATKTDKPFKSSPEDDAWVGARHYLIFVVASVSRDGLVKLSVSSRRVASDTKVPDTEQLEQIAKASLADGHLPSLFGNDALDWVKIENPGEMLCFIRQGHSGLRLPSYGYKLTITPTTEEIAARLRKRFRDLSKAEGSLPWLLSRHSTDISGILSQISTDIPWMTEHLRTRPWLQNFPVHEWHPYNMPPESLVPKVLANILNKEWEVAGTISTEAVKWCDWFFARNVVETPDIPFLGLLTALPRSWWPRKADDYIALRVIASRLMSICNYDASAAVDFLRPAKGRFAEYMTDIGKGLKPVFYGQVTADPTPGTEAYAAKQREYIDRVEMALGDCADMLVSIDTGLVSPFRGQRTRDTTFKIVLQIITRGGGLRRIIEASKRWHAQPPMQGKYNTPEHAWSRCVDPYAHKGIEVIELCTATELWEEGIRMGHCVGGDNYVESCMAARSRIVSLRLDGTSVSTAEFVLDDIRGKAFVLQHKGISNSIPPEDAAKALKSWAKAIRSGTLGSYVVIPVPMPDVAEIVLPGKGPVAWRPFIRRDLAYLSWQEFGEKVMEMHTEAKPEVPSPNPASGI